MTTIASPNAQNGLAQNGNLVMQRYAAQTQYMFFNNLEGITHADDRKRWLGTRPNALLVTKDRGLSTRTVAVEHGFKRCGLIERTKLEAACIRPLFEVFSLQCSAMQRTASQGTARHRKAKQRGQPVSNSRLSEWF